MHRRRPRTRLLAPGIFALLAGGILVPVAPLDAASPLESAPALHTELRESHPADGAMMREPVSEILLVFTTPVQAGLSRIIVLGPAGRPLSTGPVGHPSPGERDRLVVRLDEVLPLGRYEVEWRTVAPDGHVVEGEFAFEVAAASEETAPRDQPDEPREPAGEVPPPGPSGAPPSTSTQLDGRPDPGLVPAGTAQRWIHLLATVLLLGVVVFRSGVLNARRHEKELAAVAERARGNLRRLAWTAGGLLVITLVTRLTYQLGELGTDGGTAWDMLPFLLFRTAWGAGWFLHLAAIVLVVTGLVVARREGGAGRGWGILTGAAILLPLVPALQGHAMGAEARALAIPVLWVHVAAVGSWLGGLLVLILVGLPAVKKAGPSEGGLPRLARLVNAFSRVALVAVAFIVVSGAATSFLVGPGLMEIVESTWGRTLILKLALLAGAFLLGFYNWRRVRPALAERPDPGALRIPATVEAILGIIVLLVTAVLVATPLP
jgi:putative copper export protein/methionine-rich copper-binding protein CopC